MHAFTQDAHGELADEISAQRSGAPELIVVPAFGVQTHDQRRRSDAVAERFEMRRKVDASALFGSLDENDAPRELHTLLFESGDCGDGAETGITVVGTAAPV